MDWCINPDYLPFAVLLIPVWFIGLGLLLWGTRDELREIQKNCQTCGDLAFVYICVDCGRQDEGEPS